jgi:hypothetical protein
MNPQPTMFIGLNFVTCCLTDFYPHSAHASLEHFHQWKQQTSVSEYILRFEETMALMQMDYPGLTEPYFISSFIAVLKEGIKHYLIPHSPQTLCETYWKAKELEKSILIKKSLLSTPSAYKKPQPYFNPNTHPKIANPQPTSSSTKPPPATPNNLQPNTDKKYRSSLENRKMLGLPRAVNTGAQILL